MAHERTGLEKGPWKRLRIFLGEAEEWQGQPLSLALLHVLQDEGIAGATVMRGIEGFGSAHHLSTERLPDLSDNLPLVIDVVENAQRIERLLPVLERMVQRGMITLSPVEVVYQGRKS
ncbi:DUF190 domain-containing protein [Ktedonosporobacter rubrisoli]|uniref:DUF190 domain-containing protein n=1 Tax=Ktedonosporobacter rubrisoli TaxID=2509675 RepID=A0A4P6K547_KTERU|nr:DUF190 domain-containing protein [Ktedonosporobacter rubrisoli]QBD82656.1 DUF190 domain-containing protein [Ktedonosporobacter rubrisoli]